MLGAGVRQAHETPGPVGTGPRGTHHEHLSVRQHAHFAKEFRLVPTTRRRSLGEVQGQLDVGQGIRRQVADRHLLIEQGLAAGDHQQRFQQVLPACRSDRRPQRLEGIDCGKINEPALDGRLQEGQGRVVVTEADGRQLGRGPQVGAILRFQTDGLAKGSGRRRSLPQPHQRQAEMIVGAAAFGLVQQGLLRQRHGIGGVPSPQAVVRQNVVGPSQQPVGSQQHRLAGGQFPQALLGILELAGGVVGGGQVVQTFAKRGTLGGALSQGDHPARGILIQQGALQRIVNLLGQELGLVDSQGRLGGRTPEVQFEQEVDQTAPMVLNLGVQLAVPLHGHLLPPFDNTGRRLQQRQRIGGGHAGGAIGPQILPPQRLRFSRAVLLDVLHAAQGPFGFVADHHQLTQHRHGFGLKTGGVDVIQQLLAHHIEPAVFEVIEDAGVFRQQIQGFHIHGAGGRIGGGHRRGSGHAAGCLRRLRAKRPGCRGHGGSRLQVVQESVEAGHPLGDIGQRKDAIQPSLEIGLHRGVLDLLKQAGGLQHRRNGNIRRRDVRLLGPHCGEPPDHHHPDNC